MTKYYPKEYDECCLLVEYLELRGIKFSHLAQSTFTKSWGVKMKNRKMGLRKGVPDYLCIINNHLLFIEMKRQKNGNESPEQKEWILALNNCVAVSAFVCYGFDEAKKVVDKFINS